MKNQISIGDIPQILLKKQPTLVFILGGTDTGKTTLSKALARTYLNHGLRVGLVDADLGQSTIGPPTTIGMMIAKDHLPASFHTQSLYFVGNNNPVGQLTRVAVGSKLMVDATFKAGADTVIFDSSGLIQPPYGLILKSSKLELLKPQIVIAIERTNELKPILSWLAGCWSLEVLHVRPAKEVRRKSSLERKEYRQSQYKRYFQNASLKTFSLSELVLYPPDFLDGRMDPVGLLVGLQDAAWNTIAIGIIESVSNKLISIYTPFPSQAKICGLLAGYIKLLPSGIELGRIRARQLF